MADDPTVLSDNRGPEVQSFQGFGPGTESSEIYGESNNICMLQHIEAVIDYVENIDYEHQEIWTYKIGGNTCDYFNSMEVPEDFPQFDPQKKYKLRIIRRTEDLFNCTIYEEEREMTSRAVTDIKFLIYALFLDNGWIFHKKYGSHKYGLCLNGNVDLNTNLHLRAGLRSIFEEHMMGKNQKMLEKNKLDEL